uniref:Uncharacterized protein LOC111125196 n=1 Tax=Crassostrea virginica TaxID=6565 RepID=A0A8B8D8J7_CRAVI|nr:uncharacterized protein LOC111125196 [Crassostrea virginica]XP_022324444.1 uncharacterized protein LOC111125196 [Crassostrea virginica]
MVKRCAWGTCNSDSRYKDKEYMKDVTFWPIPKPKTRLRETLQWFKACNRKHFTVKNVDKHAYVCIKHFREGCPTANYPIPLTAGSPSQTQSKPTRKISVRKIATQLHLQNNTVVTSSSNADIESIPTWDLDPSPAAFISVEYTDVTDHDSNANEGDPEHLSEHGYACKKVMVDQSVQTTIQKAHLGEYEDENLLNEGNMRRKLLLKDVMKDDTSCNFYTDLSLAMFGFLFTFLSNSAKSMTYWRGGDTSNERKQTQKKGPKRVLSIKER